MAGNSDGKDVSAMVPPKKRGAAVVAGGMGHAQLCLLLRAFGLANCITAHQLIMLKASKWVFTVLQAKQTPSGPGALPAGRHAQLAVATRMSSPR